MVLGNIIKKEDLRGNIVEKAFIKHTLIDDYGTYHDYINIKRIVNRDLNFWADYFIDIKEKFDEQSTQSWITQNEYVANEKIIKTEILIMFNIEINIKIHNTLNEKVKLFQKKNMD